MAQWSLNQSRFSLSSLKLHVAGQEIIGSQKFSGTETLDGDFMWGNGVIAIGKVIGKLSSEWEMGFIPEEVDKLVTSIGVGFMEIPMSFRATFFEPANPATIYTVSNDSIWIGEKGLDAAREGAVITMKFKGQSATNWNGHAALNIAARATDPSSVGALFQAAGLSLAL